MVHSSVYWMLPDKSLLLFSNSEMVCFYPSFGVLCSWLLRIAEPKFLLALLIMFMGAYISLVFLSEVSLSVEINDKFVSFF